MQKISFSLLLVAVFGLSACERYFATDTAAEPEVEAVVEAPPVVEDAVPDPVLETAPEPAPETGADTVLDTAEDPVFESSDGFESGETSGADEDAFAIVTTYYATDRSYNKDAPVSRRFGNERSQLRYGEVEVSIPRDHRMGEIEAPSWFTKLLGRENPEKHVVLLSVDRLDKDDAFARIKAAAEGAQNAAFVYVHGYKNSFEKAAQRTAQMAYDLGFDGAPIFYSWPSQNSAIRYTVDEQNAEWTQTHLKKFLGDLVVNLEGRDIFLIAHSMGNRPLTRALVELYAENPEWKADSPFKEVILAAPDIDAAVFKRDIAPRIGDPADPVTLYVSSKDKALLASHTVHDFPRIGDIRSGLEPIEGVEVIDASNVISDFVAHNYFGAESSVISDIFYLIREGKRPSERFGLVPVSDDDSGLWRFK